MAVSTGIGFRVGVLVGLAALGIIVGLVDDFVIIAVVI